MSDVTRLLEEIQKGDSTAMDRLTEAIYDDLCHLARILLSREQHRNSISTADLAHNAFLRLLRKPTEGSDQPPVLAYKNHRHFFGAAAEAIRRILIESARNRKRRGIIRVHVEMSEVVGTKVESEIDVEALNNALEKLAAKDPHQAEIVKLRFLAGKTMPEIADLFGMSLSAIEKNWYFARYWLRLEMMRQDHK